MMCTNTIRDEVVFDENINEWEIHKLTDAEVQEKLDKQRQSWSTVLCFQWGCWVTSYGRKNLWLGGIIPHDNEVLYCDTDSVKIIGDASFIDDYNKKVIEKLTKVSKERHIPLEDFAPKSPDGETHMLGLFDWETKDGKYKKFKTLGAKKYCYVDHNDKLHLTLSGVNKKKGAEALGTIDNFKKGFIFKPEETGKLTLWYLDNIPPVDVTDYQGHKSHIENKHGIFMQPTTYALGISDNYEFYLDALALQNTTKWSGIDDYIMKG